LIAFLDADDEWMPGKLRRQVDYLEEHRDVLGTVTRLRFFLEPDYLNQAIEPNRFYQEDRIGYTPGTLVACRNLFRAVGPFEPAFSVACDADWFARMVDSSQPMAVLHEVLLVKHIHGSNMSLNRELVRKETMAVLRNSLLRKRGNSGWPRHGTSGPTGRGKADSQAPRSEDAT
jgi:hypothetical protein